VHRRLLQDPNFVQLTDGQRGQLMTMWIVAADRGGALPESPAMIRKLCQMDAEPDLQVFVSLGFLESDAIVTPTRRQHDHPEAEAEAEAETDTETTAPASPAADVENQAGPADDGPKVSGEVQAGRVDERPTYTRAELWRIANERLGLGRLDHRDAAANGRILNDWLYSSAKRDPMAIYCAIMGAAEMRDRDLVGWDSAKPGVPMTLKALMKAGTLADQGDGRAVRPFFDVAYEFYVKQGDRPKARSKLAGSGIASISEVLRKAVGE